MNPNFILPDSVFNVLVILGAFIAAVCITLADEIKAVRRERAVREIKVAVKADKVTRELADYYTAAAYGDPEDFDYWEETAKTFTSEK